jgi:isocitrate dehydrogenase (NAD+)
MPKIIVLEGDETGQELLEQALRVLDPDVTRVEVELEHYDLSLDNRPLRAEGGHDHAGGRG